MYNSLSNIDVTKACGPDGIHGKVLKSCAGSLSYPLWLLFNLSMSSGVIPDEWKLASIVPVYKKGDCRDVGNYRPISLLCLVGKIMEELVRSRILSHCGALIDPRQHGFVEGRSCCTQLLPFTHSLATNLSQSDCVRTDIIYFDFKRAFDTCNHDIILHKLKSKFGVDGMLLRYIKNYLRDRKQKVVIEGESSDVLPVILGVPQGSLLGPILFTMFINDIFEQVTEGTQILLYADDTKIWREIKCWNDHISLQRSVSNLYDWSVKNKMFFHPDKCKVLSVSPTGASCQFSTLPFFQFYYTLNDSIIDYVPQQTDLGLYVCSNLNWSSHCEYITSSMTTKFNLLRRTCYFLRNSANKRSLYLTMVRSLTEHCSPIWCNIGRTQLLLLEKLQKRVVKWIRNEPLESYTNDQYVFYLKGINCLPFKELFLYNDLRLFYQIVNNMIQIQLPNTIVPINVADLRPTRQNRDIFAGIDRSKLVDKSKSYKHSSALHDSFFHRATRFWNELPCEIRQMEDLPSFLVKLKAHLFSTIDIDNII